MTTFSVLQLGCGMQGRASLVDLLGNPAIDKVVVADNSADAAAFLEGLADPRVCPVALDARDDAAVRGLMQDADVVVEFLPGEFSLRMARLAVETGTNLVTSMYLFNPGEPDPEIRKKQRDEIAQLHVRAREKNIAVLEEFGMDPGMDLILGNRALRDLDEVKVFHSYGAGFPEPDASHNPLRYKFTWSVIGVMRSYLRPAKIVRDGRIVQIPAEEMFATQHTHHLQLPEFGEPLECFANGDSAAYAELFGLSETIRAMGRYICRWPGTGAFWQRMAQSGFLSAQPIEIAGSPVAPDAFCAALLGGQPQFRYAPTERDVALIRSDVRGFRDGKPKRVVYQIVDYRDLATGFTSMQRTVGFTASIGAQMILDGRLPDKGIVSPTQVPFDAFVAEIEKRKIAFTRLEEAWDGNELP